MNPDNRKERVRTAALLQLQTTLQTMFPLGHIKGHEFVIGNIQGDAGDSLKIELRGDKAGLWNDFASQDSGDIFNLMARHFNLDADKQFPELLKECEQFLGLTDKADTTGQTGNA